MAGGCNIKANIYSILAIEPRSPLIYGASLGTCSRRGSDRVLIRAEGDGTEARDEALARREGVRVPGGAGRLGLRRRGKSLTRLPFVRGGTVGMSFTDFRDVWIGRCGNCAYFACLMLRRSRRAAQLDKTHLCLLCR